MANSIGDHVWNSPASILLRFDTNEDGSLDYKEFRELCSVLFDKDQVKANEWRVREIFELFDGKTDGMVNGKKLQRCYKWIQETVHPVNVLLVVDVQNDFIDGSLALRNCGFEDGKDVLEPINNLLKNGRWDKVIYSYDWHPDDHISFFDNLSMRELHPDSAVSQETAKVFDSVVFSQPHVAQVLWPKHCVMNTWGAELHKDLLILPSSEQVYKGQNSNIESYSMFNDNKVKDAIKCEDILSRIGATHLYVCGIAYDICVKATCLDGLRLGYPLAIIEECCRGVNSHDIEIARDEIFKNGGLVICSNRAMSLVNEGKRSLVMAHHAAKKIL